MSERARAKRIPFVPNTVKLLLLVLIFVALFMQRAGYIPAHYSPFAAIDLNDPSGWFIDWRIAELAEDRDMCKRILRAPQISARRVKNRVLPNGCGWTNAYRVDNAGGARIDMRTTCPMAAALALWVTHKVQPAAKRYLGSRVSRVNHVGGYACRNIRGSIGRYIKIKSEHAKANAIDITGFTLANGKRVSVLRDWPRQGAKAEFLREVHSAACGFFRVTLGPEANKLHRDHFHLDRGLLRACR